MLLNMGLITIDCLKKGIEMNWKFWEKKKNDVIVKPAKPQTKPKDLPQDVGKFMVVKLGYDPDWVWALKAVLIEKENQKGCFYFRVFDPVMAHANGLKIQGYSFLDTHPNLILFDGWHDKNSREVTITDRYKELENGSAA